MFLDTVVRPLYDCVFRETFSGLKKGRPVPKTAAENIGLKEKMMDAVHG